jgi:hypothetical protein
MLPRGMLLTARSPIRKGSLTSPTDSFMLNSIGAAQEDVNSMRHVTSETEMNKHEAPLLGCDSSSILAIKVPLRRCSEESSGNETWDSESSASISGSDAPMRSAGLRATQSMSMLSSTPGSSQFTGSSSLMKKIHPSMMPGGMRTHSSSAQNQASCPPTEKKRMQLHSLGASRRDGALQHSQSQSYSNLSLYSGANRGASAPRYNEEKPTESSVRRITSDSSVLSFLSRNSAHKLPSREVSSRKLLSPTSNGGLGGECEGMRNATWGSPSSRATKMSRFHPSMFPGVMPLTSSSSKGKSSLPSRTASFLLNSKGAAQDVNSMRHFTSETAMNKHAAPLQGYASISLSTAIKMKQNRGSESVTNATWDTESSPKISGSDAPMRSAGLRATQSMSMLSSNPGSSQVTGSSSFMKKIHPTEMSDEPSSDDDGDFDCDYDSESFGSESTFDDDEMNDILLNLTALQSKPIS